MLFKIDAAVMNLADSVLSDLDQVLMRIEDEIHEGYILDADLLIDTKWFQSSRPDKRELLEQVARASAYKGSASRGVHSKIHHVVDATSAQTAKKIALTPLTILLENEFSDGALVGAAIEALGDNALKSLYSGHASKSEPPALQFETAGGYGEVLKKVRKHLSDAQERGRPARLIVVTDSDGEWPGDVKQHASDIRQFCLENAVPCPPLNKRTAENYIPDRILVEWSITASQANKKALQVLLTMNQDQRDYVHFDKTNIEPWSMSEPQACTLFATITNESRATLAAASLKGRGETMTIFSLDRFKSLVTPAIIASRDQSGDLVALVQKIADEL